MALREGLSNSTKPVGETTGQYSVRVYNSLRTESVQSDITRANAGRALTDESGLKKVVNRQENQ